MKINFAYFSQEWTWKVFQQESLGIDFFMEGFEQFNLPNLYSGPVLLVLTIL